MRCVNSTVSPSRCATSGTNSVGSQKLPALIAFSACAVQYPPIPNNTAPPNDNKPPWPICMLNDSAKIVIRPISLSMVSTKPECRPVDQLKNSQGRAAEIRKSSSQTR